MTHSQIYQTAIHSAPSATAADASPVEFVVSQEPCDREWDQFLIRTPGGHHTQSGLWAQLKETLGWSIVRLVARKSDRIIGGAQVLTRRYGPRLRIGYIPKGPIFESQNDDLFTAYVDRLHDLIREQRLDCLIVQPIHEGASATMMQKHEFRPVRLATFVRATTIIDLQPPLDDIFANMDAATRQKVRQGLRRGITVRQGDADDVPKFYELLMATARRQGFQDYSLAYFEKLWSLFAPHGHAQLVLAESNAKPISALLNIAFGDTVVNKKRGWSGEFNELRPNDTMEWVTIQCCKAAGFRFYDLEGISLEAAQAALGGEPRPQNERNSADCYKLRFGGLIQIMPPTLAYFSNPLVRWGHRALYPRIANWPIVDRLANRIKVG